MRFSEAVKIERAGGRLVAAVPARVVDQLGIQEGDVLCWTGLDDGSVEVWRVAQNPYRTLDDRERDETA